MTESVIFAALLVVSGAWGIAVFNRQSKRQTEAVVSVQSLVKLNTEEDVELDALECAIEEYVKQRRNGKVDTCLTKSRSLSA